MLKSTIVAAVHACTRRPWPVIAVGLLLTLLSGFYAARHFAINTDVDKLIASNLPWQQRQTALDKAFPGRTDLILAVITAPTPELAQAAADALAERLAPRQDLFRAVRQPDSGKFFRQNGLLFASSEVVQQTTAGLTQARPFIEELAVDPTLRGMTQALSAGLMGVEHGQLPLGATTRLMTMAAQAVEDVLAGRPASFSWHELLSGEKSTAAERRRFIEFHPVLDFSALQPGKAASDAIRKAATDLNLAGRYQANLRLTGQVPIADEEFATVQDGAVVNGVVTIAVVLLILWLALRSPKIILAVFINLVAGLTITAALGLMMVGALNLISVAFAVLFVGLGVDFAIQFSVRYRAERHVEEDLHAALRRTARSVGVPLTLAAAAVAAGFLSFLPTDYRGVSELGQIAGVGMLIAFVTTVTLLPALLTVFNPAGEPEPLGYAALAPVDRFLERRRIPIIAGTGLVVIAGLPLLWWLTFDFNPLNLRNPNTEAVSTYLQLRGDPTLGASAINIVTPNIMQARATAARMEKLPEVASTRTLASFVPPDQEPKLASIRRAKAALDGALQVKTAPPPSDGENVAALRGVARQLQRIVEAKPQEQGADAARRLVAALTALADAPPEMRTKTQAVFAAPLHTALRDLRDLLQAEPITLETLPPELIEAWTTTDGRARVEVLPSGDAADNETLRNFARAVFKVDPRATGGPISILQSGHTIVRAFIEAGIWSLLAIAILLWIVLRRFGDVLLTLIPLMVAGILTLEICVLIGMPLNFANIIALPVLLGVGVAFKIYYIMAWRAGQTELLQSPLTRAVIWSALTTATAFGSLWLSSHPGTSSMGKLLALSLVTTLCAAVLFQPALMGKPRQIREH
jgi:hopanoid biosynthesis associated RND transporter like protein HpnN